jgi:hypothetical protein
MQFYASPRLNEASHMAQSMPFSFLRPPYCQPRPNKTPRTPPYAVLPSASTPEIDGAADLRAALIQMPQPHSAKATRAACRSGTFPPLGGGATGRTASRSSTARPVHSDIPPEAEGEARGSCRMRCRKRRCARADPRQRTEIKHNLNGWSWWSRSGEGGRVARSSMLVFRQGSRRILVVRRCGRRRAAAATAPDKVRVRGARRGAVQRCVGCARDRKEQCRSMALRSR